MSWLRQVLAQKEIVLWHCTIPFREEQIDAQGSLVPSMEMEDTGGNWGFSQGGQQYGQGVYLARTAELALYYGGITLRRYWDELVGQGRDVDLFDEESAFLVLYRVHILDHSKLVAVNDEFGRPQADEFMYLGRITSKTDSGAWFEKSQYVSRQRELDAFIQRYEDASGPIQMPGAEEDFDG